MEMRTKMTETSVLQNVNSGLVLEYNGNTNAYEQRNWNGGSNQKWEISETSTEGNYASGINLTAIQWMYCMEPWKTEIMW